MAWPLAVGLLSFTLMGVADTLLMGRVSTAAQAGVGLGTVMLFVMTSFFRGLITGAQSVVAAADGAGDRDRVAEAGGAGLVMGLAAGGVATLALEACRRWLLPVMVDDPLVVVEADRFLQVAVLYPLLALVAHGLLAGVQGLGDTRARMWASWWGNLTNVGLDLVLIFGLGPLPRLEGQGAALATLVGTLVMIVIYALRYRRLLGRPRLPGREVMRDAMTLGPAGRDAAALHVVGLPAGRRCSSPREGAPGGQPGAHPGAQRLVLAGLRHRRGHGHPRGPLPGCRPARSGHGLHPVGARGRRGGDGGVWRVLRRRWGLAGQPVQPGSGGAGPGGAAAAHRRRVPALRRRGDGAPVRAAGRRRYPVLAAAHHGLRLGHHGAGGLAAGGGPRDGRAGGVAGGDDRDHRHRCHLADADGHGAGPADPLLGRKAAAAAV
ncbi:MAG: MATE family efflux transporter [bacterium]